MLCVSALILSYKKGTITYRFQNAELWPNIYLHIILKVSKYLLFLLQNIYRIVYIYIYIYIYICRMKKWNKICWILAVMLMLLELSHRVVLFRCLQHMNKIYKICVLKCFHKSDVIKLTLFSTKNLLEVTSVTLV